MTVAGTSLGTPQFMSPEQATGEAVDARSDIYSLGVVGFFALTGTLPFNAPTVQAILAMHVTAAAPTVASRRAGVPPRLAEAVDRCLRKDPAARWQSAEAFVEEVGAAVGASAPDVAPQVRNFVRMTEQLFAQVFMLVMMFLGVAANRPQAASTLAGMGGAASFLIMLQIAARARLLRADGFGYDDVARGFEIDARQREEETQLISAARERNPRHRQMKRGARLALVVGLGGYFACIVLMSRTARGSTARSLGRVGAFVALGVGLVGWAMMMLNNPRAERRLSRMVGPFWRSRAGRLFHRVAIWGAENTAATPGTGVAPARSPGMAVLELHRALPRASRRTLGELPALVRQLRAEATGIEDRLRELERAAGEAGTDLARTATGLTDAGPTGATAALASRRTALVDELHAAAQQAVADRADVMATLETLRVGLLRVRSGLGRPEDLQPDVHAARALLERVTGAAKRHA
jgi:serine/threonine-protein kinase